jgi:hypothetical protein
LEQMREAYRKGLLEHGTDLQRNRREITGDGDQSPISAGPNGVFSPRRQFYRELWSSGSDVYATYVCGQYRNFATACAMGDVKQVKAMLDEANTSPTQPSEALQELLETRETSLRLSPLLDMVSLTKNFADKLHSKRLKVVQLLLKYGARPDAKDVTGKVCNVTNNNTP